jgi:hypothetical protein
MRIGLVTVKRVLPCLAISAFVGGAVASGIAMTNDAVAQPTSTVVIVQTPSGGNQPIGGASTSVAANGDLNVSTTESPAGPYASYNNGSWADWTNANLDLTDSVSGGIYVDVTIAGDSVTDNFGVGCHASTNTANVLSVSCNSVTEAQFASGLWTTWSVTN